MNSILITRPEPGGQLLCDAIDAAGGNSLYLPTIEIQPIEVKGITANNFDMLIFTSPNAVLHGHFLFDYEKKPAVAAIGAGTANYLNQKGIRTDILPEKEFTSEALLALPRLHGVINKKIALVKGVGGRTLLEETLNSRGANVELITVYERKFPTDSAEKVTQLLQDRGIDLIVCTSCECLGNLFALAAKDVPLLRQIQLVVSSKRIADLAEALRFQHKPILTENAQNETIVASLFTE